MTWWRRIRGALGMGVTWALAWFGAGLAILLAVGPGAADVPFPLGFGLLGFLAGVVFSGVLGVTEGRRRFDQMRLGRFAAWGAVGGLLFAGAFALVAALAGATSCQNAVNTSRCQAGRSGGKRPQGRSAALRVRAGLLSLVFV
jgi:hypothetical protein